MSDLYKVIRGGESWHGGAHVWSLPVQGADGMWTPGEWTPAVKPSLCSAGWHLTSDPARWWGDGDVWAYLVEHKGEVTAYDADDAKCAVERCRLMRPLTRDELAALGIYTDGVHDTRRTVVRASGSATVRAYGSATVMASGSATVWAYGSATVMASGSATVRAYGSATVMASGSATVRAYDSATVRASGSATVTASDSAAVRAYGSATVRASDSATVRAYGSATVTASDSATVWASGSATVWASGSATVWASDSARVHTGGQAVCAAWHGTSLVLTRSDQGVIIDRRGEKPVAHTDGEGLDGWRYTGGSWVSDARTT